MPMIGSMRGMCMLLAVAAGAIGRHAGFASGGATSDRAEIRVGERPLGIVLSFDGQTAYVANHGDGSVSVIDVAARAVSTTITVPGGRGGFALALAPDGKSLYVSGFQVDGGVRIIDTATGAVTPARFDGRAIAGGSIAVSPDGKLAYVDDSEMGGFRIFRLDTRIAVEEWLIRDSAESVAVAISPDGRHLYSVNPGCTVAILDTERPPTTPTSPDFGLPSASARIGEVVIACDPSDVKALPAGDLIAVVNADGNHTTASTLSWIDASTREVIDPEVDLGFPADEVVTGIAIAPDGDEAYILHRNRADGTNGSVAVVPMSRLQPR